MPLHFYTNKKRIRILVQPTCAPAAPSGLAALPASPSEIDLSWTDNSSNETGFLIERSPDGSTWSSLTTVGSNVTSYANTGLSSSTTHYYRVSAFSGAGSSPASNTATATTSGGAAVTTYALTGPSSGTVNTASSNFTVTLGSGTLSGPVTITPGNGGAGGSFTPGTVNLTNASRSATFTYTPITAGVFTVSTTNNGGLTNPASISYTSSAGTPANVQNFDSLSIGALPSGWVGYHSLSGTVGASATRSYSLPQSLGFAPSSGSEVLRAYINTSTTQSVLACTGYVSSVAGTIGLWLRGTNLNTSSPTGYHLRLGEYTQPQLYKCVAGTYTLLSQNLLAAINPNQWYLATFREINSGSNVNLSVRLQRVSDGYYVTPTGTYQQQPIDCFDYTDTTFRPGAGFTGVERYPGGTTESNIDNVLTGSSADTTTPTVSLACSQSSPISGSATFTPTITANPGVAIVNYTVASMAVGSGVVAGATGLNPFLMITDSTTWQDDTYTVTATVTDNNGNVGSGDLTITVSNESNAPVRYVLPQHQPHIQVYLRAYGSAIQDAFANTLTAQYVDMIDDNPNFYAAQATADPQTIRLYYINLTNTYLDLLLDYEDYCDRNSLDPESILYHTIGVTQKVNGGSHSTWIPRNFINILVGQENGTYVAQLNSSVAFPTNTTSNNAAYFGYFQVWREINFVFSTPASGGYAGVWEYCNARSLSGILYSPTTWHTLTLVSDGTSGLTTSGQITFDPPADWVRCTPLGAVGKKTQMSGSPNNLMYVRFRCTNSSGTAPVASSVLARDYGGSGNTDGGHPKYTATGNWDGVSVFTPTNGSTPASFVTVGDWCPVYLSILGQWLYVAQVVSVAAGINGAITLSTTVRLGTAPTSGTGNYTLQDGYGNAPLFDASADLDNDRYLNDAEYAARKPGYDARFLWESRVCLPGGLTRYPTLAASSQLAAWGADFGTRLLATVAAANPPGASGLMFDNVQGSVNIGGYVPAEGLGVPDTEQGNCNRGCMQAMRSAGYEAYLQNIAGGASLASTNRILAHAPYAYEEFGIRVSNPKATDFKNRLAQQAAINCARPCRPPLICDRQLSAPGRCCSDPLQHYGHLCFIIST